MAIIQKIKNVFRRMGREGNTCLLFVGFVKCGKQYGSFSKFETETAIWFSNSISDILSEEKENTNEKSYITWIFNAELFTIAKMWYNQSVH